MTFFDFMVYLLENQKSFTLVVLFLVVSIPLSIRAFMQSWPEFEKSQFGQWLCRQAVTLINLLRQLAHKLVADIKEIISFTSPKKIVIPNYTLGKFFAWFFMLSTAYCAAIGYMSSISILVFTLYKSSESFFIMMIGLLVTLVCFAAGLVNHGLSCQAAKENGIHLKPWNRFF